MRLGTVGGLVEGPGYGLERRRPGRSGAVVPVDPREREAVATLLQLSPGAGDQHWRDFTDQLRALLGVSMAAVYGLSKCGRDAVTAFAWGSGVPEVALKHTVDALAKEAGLRTYDPVAVSPTQANRVLDTAQLHRMCALTDEAWSGFRCEVEQRLGLRLENQLRFLAAERRTMLAWVGGLRTADDEPFSPRARAVMRRLLPVVRERLILDERLRRAPLVSATLGAALQLFDEPVLLVDAAGTPVLLNPVAQALWDTDDALRDAALDATKGVAGPFRVTEVLAEGLPRHLLLVRRGDDHAALARKVRAARDWRLTPREVEVLSLVVQGSTNAAIARELECAERTVELHLTRLLEKSLSENRATLIARFWTGER